MKRIFLIANENRDVGLIRNALLRKIIQSKQLTLMLVLLLFITTMMTGRVHAQSAPVVAIDSLTGKPSSNFPFDSPFELKYPISGGVRASSAILFKVSGNGCLGNILSLDCRQKILKKNIDTLKLQIANESDLVKKNALKKRLKQQLTSAISLSLPINKQNGADVYIDMPALEPNKAYRVFVMASPAKVDGLEDILKKMDNNQANARLGYDSLAKNYVTVIKLNPVPCNTCDNLTFQLPPFDAFQQTYSSLWKNPWADLQAARDELKTDKAAFAGDKPKETYDKKFDAIVADFLGYAQQCIKCDTKAPQYELLAKNTIDAPSVLISLKELQNSDIYNGTYDLSLLHSTVPDPDETPETMVQNLNKSILELQLIAALSDYFKYKYNYANAAIGDFNNYVSAAITTYEGNLVKLRAYAKKINDQAAKVKTMEAAFNFLTGGFFNQPINNVRSDTWTYNFDTRATYALRADFGFMVYGNPWNNPSFKGFLPYAGFHVNLRPMNTDIPFSQISNKNIWSYLSLNAGAVIGSLAQAGVRDGLVGGTSIYTGLGVSFSHDFRFTFGGVWFRKYDPNPLIDRKTAGVTPYFGLSMDFRLKDIYNGFKKIFEP